MTQLMELIYNFTCQVRFPGRIDQKTYSKLEELEARTLTKLKQGLSSTQLEALERHQDACREQRELEQEAMFLAAFDLARELL